MIQRSSSITAADHRKAMFNAIFRAGQDDMLELVDYLRFLVAENASERIRQHPKFAPSSLWTGWASETFVGFSTDHLLLQSGHAFAKAVQLNLASGPHRAGWYGRLRSALGAARSALRAAKDGGAEDAFRYWGAMPGDDVNLMALELNPRAYLRNVEALNAIDRRQKLADVGRYLEIGAGAAFGVIHLRHINPKVRCVIVDLPETIFAAYIALRCTYPELAIALPHRNAAIDEYDVVFKLPFQTDNLPGGGFDLAFNMSSFQEMSPDTVSNYIDLIADKLRPGGLFAAVNQEKSRYIQGNDVAAYNLQRFDAVKVEAMPYHSLHSAEYGVAMKLLTAMRSHA